ncbi:hypothetical protein DICPUDRAFT_153261 [Dictyostelium purpureum]|uniref:Uncharacterized protein n=1 Tax=Dictyostelium purpureum TaxID=5786 RepID=F0ZNG0_DICPU|nr:uncharacterized protein DICPUDRAFT_153261 [Dictyostelium purpureum]EGC34508.1 hypothetical protein DICPUDRAFT_153261 [Dictyostelium purpureum]|eukprot:XP_003288944.1 hypothetical protein DICPUDRAFT_153261 [Dictyostelium purpureum]
MSFLIRTIRSGAFKTSIRNTNAAFQSSALNRAERPPIHFKDNKYDGELPELFEINPDFMSPDADAYLEQDPGVHANFFFKFFGMLAAFGFTCYLLCDPNNKQVVERDLPFNNLYLEYGGDPNVVPDEKEWRVRMGDRQAIYNSKKN